MRGRKGRECTRSRGDGEREGRERRERKKEWIQFKNEREIGVIFIDIDQFDDVRIAFHSLEDLKFGFEERDLWTESRHELIIA